MITRRLNLPYSVGLVAAGILLAVLPFGLELPLTPELVFSVFLPPLVFEAAIQIPWRPFRRELPLLLALVTVGVLLAAGYRRGRDALSDRLELDRRRLLRSADRRDRPGLGHRPVQEHRRRSTGCTCWWRSESLLNDGVAAVAFAILVAIAAGEAATPLAIGGDMLFIIGGGLLAGAVVAVPLLAIAGRTTDHLVEITLTTLAAWGSFLLAEHFHVSGVLAALTAGLLVGNVGWMGSISDSGRPAVLAFWEYVAFLANSLVFLLIGGREAEMPLMTVIEAAAVAVVLSLIGRAAAVYPLAALFRAEPAARSGQIPACAVVGRIARRARIGAGAGAAGDGAGAGRHHHCGIRGRRLLDLRAGAYHGAADAADGPGQDASRRRGRARG